MVIVGIIFVIICAIAIIVKLVSPSEAQKKAEELRKAQAKAEAQFTPVQVKFLQTVGGMYMNNVAISQQQIYEECGIPREVIDGKNAKQIEQHIPFEKGSDAYNVFLTYLITVSKRYELQNYPLIEMPGTNFGVNLHNGENVYHAVYRATLFQEKTTITNIAYSGAVWRSGPLRAGNLAVINNEITRFSPIDYGKILITNERIIFIGNQKNVTKQIKINDILSCNLYKDGVIVNNPNKKPLLFKFDTYKDFEILDVSDQINQFMIALDRMIAHNFDVNLACESNAVQADSKPIVNNIDSQLNEVIKEAQIGVELRASTIQRKLAIGYNRASTMIDNLAQMGLIDSNHKWVVHGSDSDTINNIINRE